MLISPDWTTSRRIVFLARRGTVQYVRYSPIVRLRQQLTKGVNR
jgi:hypothetical protein